MSGEDLNPILDEAYKSLNEVLEGRRDIDENLAIELERTRDTIEDVRNRVERLEDRNEQYQDALDTVLTDFEDMARAEINEQEALYEELRNFRHDLEDIADHGNERTDTNDAVDELDSQRDRGYDEEDDYTHPTNDREYEDPETDRRGFGKWFIAALTGGALVSAGAIGQELLEEQEDSTGSTPPTTPEETPTENSTEETSDNTPEETAEDSTGFNLSNLAGRNPLPESSYEAQEQDYADIGDIIENYRNTSGLSQFGDDLEEEWLENSATSLNLGLTSVKVQDTTQGSRLVYEENDPDGYIGQLWDFDDDIKTSYVFDSEDLYDEALEIMEDYN